MNLGHMLLFTMDKTELILVIGQCNTRKYKTFRDENVDYKWFQRELISILENQFLDASHIENYQVEAGLNIVSAS